MNLTINEVQKLLKNHPKILPPNSSIDISPGCSKTDGYVSYLHKITIETEENQKYVLIIKCAPQDKTHRELMSVQVLYLSEIYFYSKILPEFHHFLNEGNSDTKKNLLPILPTFITAVTTPYKEVLILEDVRQFGYKMRDKKLFLDEEHIKFVLKEFGKLHAFSFALKYKNQARYENLIQGLKNIHGGKNCNLNDETNSWYRATLKQVKELFQKDEDIYVYKKLQAIEDSLEEYCENILEYDGDFGVVSHMDCWSNNMLFTYNALNLRFSGDLEYFEMKEYGLDSICFLDFQYVWVVSPAVDFSFILYVNGKPEEYAKLDDYLKHYYQSLEYHCNLLSVPIEDIYPYSKFMEEIQKYARYGFLRGLIGIPMSMRPVEEIIDVKDVVNSGMETSKAFGTEWGPECSDWMRRLTLHMIEHDFI